MAATATASSSGPRYAPEDPTLPRPWRGLVDGKTGYLYFWNPETNVTQYERPAHSVAPPKSSVPSSSVQVQQSSQGQRRGYSPDDDDKYARGSNGGSKPEAGSRSQQVCVPLILKLFFMYGYVVWPVLILYDFLLIILMLLVGVESGN